MKLIGDIIFDNPNVDPGRLALQWDEGAMTYGEFADLVARVAAALKRDGIARGDRVSVLMGNEPEYLASYFAITAMGAVYVPLNWRLLASEHINLMKNSGVKLLITSAEFAETIELARKEIPELKRIVSIGACSGDIAPFAEWSQPAASPPERGGIDRDDIAAIVYTSGTTSLPKGACLTHRNITVDLENIIDFYARIEPTDTVLQVAPLYHQTIVHSLIHFRQGATVHLLRRFNPDAILKLIAREGISYIFLAPTMLYELLDRPDRSQYDLSTLKTVVYGAAPITGARLQEAIAVFGRVLVQGYGLTEATSHVSALGREDHLVAEGSIGRGIPGVDLRVVNEKGEDCGPDEAGELLIRAPTVMKGYWQDDEKTAETIIDGWLHSGDLVRRDERGFMYIVDRKKDLVISGGANIYPSDIENVFARHPAVAEVAAFGVPDDYWGEALTVALVPRPGKTIDIAEVLTFARQHLGGYQVPKRVEVVKELPRNPSGKILKRVLRDTYGANAAA